MIYSILSSSVTLCPALMVVEENKIKYYFQFSTVLPGPGWKPHKLTGKSPILFNREKFQYTTSEKTNW